jgi:hypothetical protein
MVNNKQTYQSDLVWEPSPVISRIEKIYPVKDGENLPNSITEDVGGFSLCPHYSKKQLRRISKLQRSYHKEIHKITTNRKSDRSKKDAKYNLIKRIFLGEGIL